MQVPGMATVGHHVRAAAKIAPGRPALWLGLRAAAATALPLALAAWLDPAAATWAPLAGYGVALVDKGGAYRSRAKAMGSVALGSLVAVVVGTLVAGSGPLAIAVITLGATACALGRTWGPSRTAVGNTIAIHLTLAASLPITGVGSVAFGFTLGAAWALVLGLVVWPVRVYKPGRRAIAAVLSALADLAWSLSTTGLGGSGGRADLTRTHGAIRERLEVARQILVSTRRGRRGESGRGARLLAILHACDQMFGALVALEEMLDAGCPPATRDVITHALGQHAAALSELAERVVIENRQPPPHTPPWDRDAAAAAALAPADGAPTDRALSEHALLMFRRADDGRHRAAALIDSMVDDAEPMTGPIADVEMAPSLRDRLAEIFDRDSAVRRHALRVAICVGLSATIAWRMQLHHGYWITVTTFVLLQPQRAATTTRAIQRGFGTVAGVILAAGVAWLVRDTLPLMMIIVMLAGVGASVLQLNYALFSLFQTPTFVLLAEIHTQDFTLFEIRALYTLIGGALAFAASTLLWPQREAVGFGERMASAVECAARYMHRVIHAVSTGTPSPSPDIVAARRSFGLSLNHADLALDRVLAERVSEDRIEPRMAMLLVTRQLGGAITVFASTRAIVPFGPHAVALSAYAASVEQRLVRLAAAIRTQTPPVPWPPAVPEVADVVIRTRLDRIELQLGLLADAVTRATTRI